MRKFFTLLIIIGLSHFSTLVFAQDTIVRLTKPLPVSLVFPSQPKFISFEGNIRNNKIMLQWLIQKNEAADQFIVEKSVNGKPFVMAALVFGTDKPEAGNYEFYEKTNNIKASYRIKLITKKQEIAYSAVVEIDPNFKTSEN